MASTGGRVGKEEIQIGAESKPRYEFRSFGQDFDRIHHRMARLSLPVPEEIWERVSDETYIISRWTDRINAKIREDQLDVKQLAETVEGCELWTPLMKMRFPLPAEVVVHEVFPLLDAQIPEVIDGKISFNEFNALVQTCPDVQIVRIRKRRFAYLVDRAICEYATVLVNGARIVTVSCESTDPDHLRRAQLDIGMSELENINYIQAIKRVIGITRLPLANE